MQYQQHADAALKAKSHQSILNAWSLSTQDPSAAVQNMNDAAKLLQTGESYGYQRTPTGFQIQYKGPDGTTVKDYSDPQAFANDTMNHFLPYLEDPAKMRETNAEVALKGAQAKGVEADTALNPAKLNLLQAQAGAAGANAAESMANVRDTQGQAQARIDLLKAQTGAAERANSDQKNPILNRFKAMGIGAQDPLGMTPYQAGNDLKVMLPLGEALKSGGADDDQATVSALRLIGTDPNGWKMDKETGSIMIPDGSVFKVGTENFNTIRQVMIEGRAREAAAAAEAAQQ
jgi:hypothetical protein